MSTSQESRVYLGAHVVTRPNPGVVGRNGDLAVKSSDELLRCARASGRPNVFNPHGEYGIKSRQVLFHSFRDMDVSLRGTNQEPAVIVPYENGFVNGIIRAFQQDLHLVLRPDDVWLAIMLQFSRYVNGHAEQLRHLFVAHKGQKQLTVDLRPHNLATLDFHQVAMLFADQIQQNVVDPDLKAWMSPNFSTTTNADLGVSAMVMMATTKKYFTFLGMAGCGFPSVTLLGEREDWVHLVQKIGKLATYGEELATWSTFLAKIAEKMVDTFDQPDSQSVKDFWMRAVHEAGENGSSDVKTLSGWLTVFCYWSELGSKVNQYSDEYLNRRNHRTDRRRLVVDGIVFPIIAAGDVPRAIAEVPIVFLDYESGIRYDTTVVTGFMGVESTTSEEGKQKSAFSTDTVQPRSGYFILVNKTDRM
ncbi:hypothetical protein MKX08_001644 [Trichoderma sp. CBMAI-0020]|nr:hypothetical protein MKX08_001644 [Trichoderma sp. CBMAI-0020]